ncbi:gliding motility-associated C-terminal domain-containing protein [Maribacter sp. 1_MG-2023]|uniref:T9SS type B sorting domain-containing protein n=1 Tax=Maribacter sp. 1_MG-2023 TaxID=3062677 RepID=UPI0026E484E6|nr:gliding motility-associated C-terminal domain-containing protein [Maribacter sp. 1_MG-2023]MDO6471616.1 gliding motility-associated C-terminal domain-containing protein [Maribacter sp. 1_MG-2023]
MKTLNKLTVFTALSMLFCAFQLSAQAIVINAPEPADNPNLSGSTPWSAVCAGNGGFNEYFVNITWIGTANAGNEFILELSDASGSFTNAQTLQTITDQNAVKDFDTSFAIPTDTRGEGYKMRVRSTDPVKVGSESEAFNMYYMDVTSNLNISELGDGVPPGTVCSTGAITLQVDNIANPETYQYIWFRSGTELTSETGHTLNVTQSGMYNVYINYGPRCTGSGNTDSNIVDVTIGGSGTGIAVIAPTKTSLCSTDTEMLSIDQTDASWNYQWFKDDVEIVGATATSYNVNAANAGFEGDYAVEISGTGICNERSPVVTITNAELYTVTVENEINMVLLPTQNEVLSVSTTAVTPSYKWFRNAIEISGETNSTLTITEDGEYYAEVTQTGGACSVSSKNSDVTTVVSPASFEITINYTDAYTSCETTSTILGVELINAVAADGTITDVTSALLDGFTYEWSKDGAAISGATSNSISLASNSENGDYDLNATINSFDVDSNVLPVQLLTNETVSITSSGTVFCSGGETITLSTTTDLSSATYQWQLDGLSINTTDAVLTVSTAGTYTLAIDIDGCSLISNDIVVTPLDENLITLDPGTEIVMPEGTSRVVTASGGTAYRWLDANAVELSNSDSITFTEAGSYTLIASIDNCEIVRQIEVTYLDTFKVPNVITVNGDGINDQWIIPNSYSNKADVNVIIYNEQGQEIVNEFEYKNNWPQSTTAFTKQNMVFYYKIRNASEVLKQGTITVIR